jgi:pSer/pThr/pTyr-binding forkhead associated (FHA) protein
MADRLAPNSSGSQAGPSKSHLALRFISGKYQGGEFPIEEGQDIVIGRSSDLDMVLVEEMVSRRHAHIKMRAGVISIEDLGSTNGTFVNGEKVQRAQLKEGDRVLIGTSILKVVALGGDEPGSRQNLESVAVRRVTQRGRGGNWSPDEAPRMTGNLEEIPLPDLLQLFGTSRKTGVLVLRGESKIGRIFLKDGKIHFATIEDQPRLAPLKAMYRMLGWKRGLFELDPPESRTFEKPLDLSAQEVLMEGFRQQDELNVLLPRLPGLGSRLTLRTPLEAPLHELEPKHLDVLQQALNSTSLEALLDRTTLTDLEIAEIVASLIKRGYLSAGK